jgi:hypothetical protein
MANDPFNRCIYCDCSDLSKLSDEHALAEALGGRVILKKAVCDACKQKIDKFENHVHNQMFSEVRAFFGFVRAKAQGYRGRFPVEITKDGERETIRVPIDKHPTILFLPVWPEPGLVLGRRPRRTFPNPKVMALALGEKEVFDKKLEQLAVEYGASKVSPIIRITPNSFGRYVAKATYCIAISRYGLDSFIPVIRNVILHKDAPTAHFVGSVDRNTSIDIIDTGYFDIRVPAPLAQSINPQTRLAKRFTISPKGHGLTRGRARAVQPAACGGDCRASRRWRWR